MDNFLLFKINQDWTHPVLDYVMTAASALGIWIPVFAVVLVGIFWKCGVRRAGAFVAVMAVAIAVTDGLVCKNLKGLVNRPRPHQVVLGLTVRDVAKVKPKFLAVFKAPWEKPSKPSKDPAKLAAIEGRSFPSAHTANTWAAALVAMGFFGRRFWWLFLPAALVSYSRVYVGSHWPSDIFPSILIGILCGFLTLFLWKKVKTRRAIGKK